ncbi:hypothetical protein DFR29_114152 [Tahibacter aquaticus]|uniref:Uncharacterized protein n=1 Tax=Tahibacter aquaticus TaxID=520092 RepID=A0A4R6YQD0_9GAMM|nr:hypothetical protein [Tahibacter aquaticus]TDR40100.1 hypothetical protein DFR29_114152 [Tahibacter aquaticus]
MLTLRHYLKPSVLALGLALMHNAWAQESSSYINHGRMLPDPTTRITNRTTLAPELGGWNVYTGQLHSHTRGHDDPSAVLSWQRIWGMAWNYGYDFFSRNNHSTSWEDYDSNRPYLQEYGNTAGAGVVMISGQENYYDGGNHPPGSHDHPNHYNTINGWPKQKSGNLSEFYAKIIPGYTPDASSSIHVQLNHVAPATADYTQLPADAARRDTLRRIVDTVEIAHGDGSDANHLTNLRSYFTLLRNGWRVSPTAHYDVHAERDNNSHWGARNADGSLVRPWVHFPGQPYEVVQRANGEQNFAPRGRTGMVLPQGTPWGSNAFLNGLSERRTFRTTMDRSVGMYAAGDRVMGDEFSLVDNSQLLRFKVWGRSFAQHDGSRASFSRAELWSPARPDAPIRSVDLANTTDFGAELFALTPYESVYLVRLVGAWNDHDIVMAPVWISNPRAKLTGASFLFPTPSGGQLLMWSGGGKRVQIQRARVHAPHYPKNWETVAEVDNINRYGYDISNEPVYTFWRVVDPSDAAVVSNEVLFTRPNRAPLGSFDELNVAAGKVRGWTFDPDHSTSPITVHVYQGSTFVTSGVTGLARPDVQQAHGTGANSGYEIQLPANFRTGTRSFSVYALDLDAEPNPLLGGSPRTGNFGPPPGGEVEEPPPLCELKPWLPQCNPGGG